MSYYAIRSKADDILRCYIPTITADISSFLRDRTAIIHAMKAVLCTPAKIKSEVRQNRAIDLHEEIKQISNVIQDLVQTINVRNGSKSSINNEGLTDDDQFDGAVKIININNNTITNGIHSSF